MSTNPYLSLQRFPGDGTTTVFSVNFAGSTPDNDQGTAPYLDLRHIRANVIVPAEGGQPATVTPIGWEALGPATFRIEHPTPVGHILEISRNTPRERALVDYRTLQVVSERDLDTANRQLLYILQEALDRAALDGGATGSGGDGDGIDYEARQIARDALDKAEEALSRDIIDDEARQTAQEALTAAVDALDLPAAQYPRQGNLKSLAVNGTLMSGGGFPVPVRDEIVWSHSGGNPSGNLLRQAATDLGECTITPPSEGGRVGIQANYPWKNVNGSDHRVIPVVIQTHLFNSPVAPPLFEVVEANESGVLLFKYIGDRPLHTVIKGSLSYLVRTAAATPTAASYLRLRLYSMNHPHLEVGQTGGARQLAVSDGSWKETFKLQPDRALYSGRNIPVTAGERDNLLTESAEDYTYLPGYFTSSEGSTIEALRTSSVGARSTSWIPLRGAKTLGIVYRGTIVNGVQVRYKTAEGDIKYFTVQSGGPLMGYYTFPEEAVDVQFSVGDQPMPDIHIVNLSATFRGRVDPTEGWWQHHEFHVNRDVTFWPGTTYWLSMITQVLVTGGSGSEHGFRCQSGGLSFLFDAGSYRKQQATKLYEDS